MLYFLVFCCYWWQSWNNSHALSPRFLLLLWTRLEQQSCFTSSFSVVTGDKVGTIVMLYVPVFSCYWWQSWNNSHALLPRFLLLLVTKLEQQSCFISPFSLVTGGQSWNNSHAFSLVTGDKGWNGTSHALSPRFLSLFLVFCWWQSWTTVMLYFLVFCCYWWQSWNNSHALSPRFLLLLVTKLKQQSCFTSSFSVVTGDKVGTIVMLYLPVFSCYCGQGWNNSHALLPRFLLLLVTKLEQ